MLRQLGFQFASLFTVLSTLLLSACGSPEVADNDDAKPSAPKLELATLTDQELSNGWISLFDGQTLFGWVPQGDADWRVEDGAIVVSSGQKCLLCTSCYFDSYVLRVDFRADKETNSGIFLRTAAEVGPDDVTTKCYELNIAPDDNPFPTGSLVKRAKVEGSYQSDDWQTYEVTVDGAEVTVNVDDETILQYNDPDPIATGFIGLQHNSGKVAFRNIKLKPLGLESIFNGEDLSGWKDDQAKESKFSVTEEGYLNVKNGRGQLESEGEYGDFVLQLECISNKQHLNSGIFFRCIPGDVMNGYESQIHNGFEDSDRQKPMDWGTGGIFKRQVARIVAADDLKWFHKTLIVQGPHIAVWVNGMHVTDWTDNRQPNENPRRGLRTEPGTIMIQGHDPTTDLSFRNLEIANSPAP